MTEPKLRLLESGDTVPEGVEILWQTAVEAEEPKRGQWGSIPWFPAALAGMGQTSLGRQVPVLLWRRAIPDTAKATTELT